MIPQHQFLGVEMQIHLLVHPLGHRMAVVVIAAFSHVRARFFW
jgi:hypothetical protein